MKRSLALLLCAAFGGVGASEIPSGNETPLASVYIFLAVDCPIANAYAPEINRIFETFHPKGVEVRLVYPDIDLRDEEMAHHVEEYGLLPPPVVDREHALVERAGATITPEAVVFSPSGEILYRGRIDNLFADYGTRRRVVTEHYLRDALDAILRGLVPPVSRTEAIGCVIEPVARD